MAVKEDIEKEQLIEQDVVDRAKKVLQNISKKETNRALTIERLSLAIEAVELSKEALRINKIGFAKTKDILDRVRDNGKHDVNFIAQVEHVFSNLKKTIAEIEGEIYASELSLNCVITLTESNKGAGKIGSMLPKGKAANKQISDDIKHYEEGNEKRREIIASITDTNNNLTDIRCQVGAKVPTSENSTEKS